MISKIYQAATMAEALAEVKRDLGRSAVILHTRRLRKGGLWGMGGRHVWEVTASPNINVPPRIPVAQYVPQRDASAKAPSAPRKAPVAAPPRPAGDAAAPAPQPGAPDAACLARQVDEIRRMVETLLAQRGGTETPPMPPELVGLRARLIEQDVPADAADELVAQLAAELTGRQLAEPQTVRDGLRKLLAGRIRTARPDGDGKDADGGAAAGGAGRVVAFIGPTGVGKTTTIAKLAARHKLHRGRSVGLITMDTYRIAAVDQLRTYAEIIEVPIRAVLSTGELHHAVQEMRDLDLVLIDTAGRSQNNSLRLSQLRGFLGAARPDEVNLVISATSNRRCTQEVLDRFLPLGADRIIVTKLDEAGAFGVFLNASSGGGRPISYVTTGQDVPDDIAPAEANALADCIVRGAWAGREQ